MSPEPWLRGPIEGVDAVLAAPIHALQQAAEDTERYAGGLSEEEVWRRIGDVPAVGFHLKHLAGSLDRLTSYLREEQISAEQLAFLSRESNPEGSAVELIGNVHSAIARASEAIRTLDPTALCDARYVGRKRLRTTAIGLAVHIAEHTQRHVGALVVTAKLVRSG